MGWPCRENTRKKDVRLSNIEAAKAVADAVRTSLGPRGMDKMVNLFFFFPPRLLNPAYRQPSHTLASVPAGGEQELIGHHT